MTYKEIQDMADEHGFGQVFFQYKIAQNTGKEFEVGYVTIDKQRQLFCKRQSYQNQDQFYLCNEFRKLDGTD